MLCTFPGGGYVHFEIDTLDTITLLENGGYLVIVSTVLGYLVIASSVLRVKCYGVQSMGYRVIVSTVQKAIMDIVQSLVCPLLRIKFYTAGLFTTAKPCVIVGA